MFVRYIVGSASTALFSNVWWTQVSLVYAMPQLCKFKSLILKLRKPTQMTSEAENELYVPSPQLDRRLT